LRWKVISDEALLDAYRKAIKYELSKDFISLLEEELKSRSLLHKIKDSQSPYS